MDSEIIISVIMPSYNTPIPFLKEAIDSILIQTFTQFELIIIDDCSTDESAEYLHGLHDERIKIIRNSVNLGVTRSLNVGIKAAQGKYIARMDSDDISLPERFEKQVALMESHPEIVMCGSRVEKFGVDNGLGIEAIQDMELYKARMLFCYPGPMHPTIFIRRDTLLKNHLTYDEHLIYAQDYGLYSEIIQYGNVYCFPEVLVKYRTHKNQITETRREIQNQCAKSVQKKMLLKLLKNVTEEEIDMHYRYSSNNYSDVKMCDEIDQWYKKLEEVNRRVRVYNPVKFQQTIIFVKRRLITKTIKNNMSLGRKINFCFHYLPFVEAAKTLIRSILNL